jgi:hypothetical protein
MILFRVNNERQKTHFVTAGLFLIFKMSFILPYPSFFIILTIIDNSYHSSKPCVYDEIITKWMFFLLENSESLNKQKFVIFIYVYEQYSKRLSFIFGEKFQRIET